MDLTLTPVISPAEVREFVTFPWMIYRNDPFWVPPLIEERIARLDVQHNPFWKEAESQLWIARLGSKAVGTIAAIEDRRGNRILGEKVGTFGFFECVDDPQVANCLLEAAADWLRRRGMVLMRGPYNPDPTDDYGILVEGFDTLPSVMMPHNPPYYRMFFEGAGYTKHREGVARLYRRLPEQKSYEEAMPEKLRRVAERAAERPGLRVRPMNLKNWESEIRLACRMFNETLKDLPDRIMPTEEEFLALASPLQAVIDPELALIAEIDHQPAGFALALPDVNPVLRHANGRLGPLTLFRLWWYLRRPSRASFKIIVVLPQYQYRGVEAVLIDRVGRALWDKGYQELDMSMTGDENWKSNRFQDSLGFQVYRRYRVYEKPL